MKKITITLITIIIIMTVIMLNRANQTRPQTETTLSAQSAQTDKPRIVSTKPEPLENTIISATEVIEITFNKPLENKGEFKLRIEPETKFDIELTNERKTARIIPLKPYELGKTYTLFIGTETKFDGVGRWGEERIYHVRTVQYRGV